MPTSDEDWNDLSLAEKHWDVLPPSMARGFALGLARMGIPVAEFLRHTNKALAAYAVDPDSFMRELGGHRPAGEPFVPDTAVLHPDKSETSRVDEYIARRYPGRE
jgi:hypothetical protein